MKALYLLRHAKSSRDDDSLPDHDRPLSKRGRRDAEAIARHLAAAGLHPDLVLSSTALRTRETLAPIQAALKPRRVVFDNDLYLAPPTTLLDHLASVGIVVEFADHLSDRELYAWLLESGHLEAHIALLPDSFLHIDVIGSGSDEDNCLYLTYYASDEERAEWKRQFPDDELPPRKRLLHAS